MKIIVFIESSNNKIHPVSLEALVAAQKLKHDNSSEIHTITFDRNLANQLSEYKSDSVIHVENSNLNQYNPLCYLETLKQIYSKLNPDIIIFGHTYETRDWVPI